VKYHFECKVDDNAYYEFNEYSMLYPNGKKQMFLRSKLLMPVLFLIMWVTNLVTGKDWEYLLISASAYFVVSVIWFFAVKPLNLLFLKINIKALAKKGKLPYWEHSRISFFDEYYIDESSDVKEETKYKAITHICDNKGKAIYLYQGTYRATIISYNSFESEAERNEFLSFIEEKTQQRA